MKSPLGDLGVKHRIKTEGLVRKVPATVRLLIDSTDRLLIRSANPPRPLRQGGNSPAEKILYKFECFSLTEIPVSWLRRNPNGRMTVWWCLYLRLICLILVASVYNNSFAFGGGGVALVDGVGFQIVGGYGAGR